VEERSNHSASSRPVAGGGLVFFATGWSTGQLLAVRPGEKGEVMDANQTQADPNRKLQLVWKSKRGVPKKPSMLLVDDLLFTIGDDGVAGCLEAATGHEIWRERVGGNHSASPVLAEGRIYFFNEEGKATVIAASREFRKLAENHLENGFMASPAIADQAFYLRTKTHLYRVEER
jgi:outer membrane protein assembly factor BamB